MLYRVSRANIQVILPATQMQGLLKVVFSIIEYLSPPKKGHELEDTEVFIRLGTSLELAV